MNKSALYFALGVIFFANFLSYLDRQIIGALEVEIRHHFSISQSEFGIVGSAFTVGYMVFAPIVGFLIARRSRPHVFALCVLIWSIATIASGYAPNLGTLIATRFFIGIGEAGCLVIGPTLISDYFPKEVRGKALSVFFLALPLGGTAGYIVGGLLSKAVGWQQAFFFAGVPGFLVAALIWRLVDPPRGGEGADSHQAPVKGIKPYFDLLKNRTLFLIILAQAFAVMFLQPLLLFGVGFFQEERQFTKNQATVTLGLIALVAGGLGNMLSGVLGDRLARKTKGAYALLAGIAFTLGLPFLLVGFSVPSPHLVIYLGLGLGAFCYFLCMPAVNTQIANSVAPQQRAMAYALAVFILHFLGDTGAPYVFGKVSDSIGSKQQSFVIFSFSLLLAGACCFFASRTAGKDEAKLVQTPS